MARLITEQSERFNRDFYRLCLTENYPFALDLRACHGSYLHTVEGQDILDWAGFYGSKMIAYNHPRLYDPAYVERLLVAANNKVFTNGLYDNFAHLFGFGLRIHLGEYGHPFDR